MNISGASPVSPSLNNLLSPLVNGVRQGADRPASSVVSLSSQGQALSQSGSTGEQSETGAKEVAEPPGIQFMEGENKGGRVNTFA